ncbi:MAG: gluconate 2-dehydrogenase subunit 3 family protein [Acidimicrobiia bacterium]|nr:gluconate 2-dehydrogenase subunit 3 family protein [Acidimicrobiia bacterium]
MSEVSRRDVLRNIALSATLGGLSADAAQHVHHAAAEEKKASGVYKPKAFNGHEYRTVGALSEMIIPGAKAAGAAEFIDLLASGNPEFLAIFTGGIAWMDRRVTPNFVDAGKAEQTALLDQIAYRKNDSPELGAGIRFFEWARKMAADAYYTSKAGMEELGYKGNVGMTEFKIPQEAIDWAVKRSPFGG